jgi:excisionase family DNA binding protein
MDEKLLTVQEVASLLNVSTYWVYDHTSRSEPKVPHLRLGGHLRFRRKDIEEFIEKHLVRAA